MSAWAQIERLMAEVVAGGEGTWERLLEALEPKLSELAARQPLGRLRDDIDVQRDIVTKVIAKLHKDDCRALAKFVGSEDPPPVEAWLRVVTRNAAIDVMRARPEYVRARRDDEAGWLSLVTLATADGRKPPESIAAKRREVESFLANAVAVTRERLQQSSETECADELARDWKIPALHTRRLIKRLDEYEPVLAMVLAGHTQVEIAERLAITRREVELCIRYLEELFHAFGFAA